jgi:hypothetical protein
MSARIELAARQVGVQPHRRGVYGARFSRQEGVAGEDGISSTLAILLSSTRSRRAANPDAAAILVGPTSAA